MSNRKIVLITGNAGFIGSHIADEFIKHKYTVLGIDNLRNGSNKNIHPSVKFFQEDLNKITAVETILKKYQPHILIHNASNLVDVSQSIKNPGKAFKDTLMTVKLLEKAKKYGVDHVIFPSSANVYGNQIKQPIAENSEIQPLSPYGLSKAAIEEYLAYFSHVYKIPVCIFRYFNVFGPRQSIKNAPVIPTFIINLMKHKKIHLYGGDQTRDFVFVTDVAKANYIASEKKISGIYNIASGEQIKIKQVLLLLEKLTTKQSEVKKLPKNSADYDSSQALIKKVEKDLYWKPQVLFEEGLKQTVTFYSQEYFSKKMKKNNSASYSINISV